VVSGMGTRWNPLSTAAKMSAVEGSAGASGIGLWGASVFVLPDGSQPSVSRLSKTTIWQARMLPRWAPRWILLNCGKVMGVMLLRLGNSGLAGNVKNLGDMSWVTGFAGTGLRSQGSSGESVAFALCARGFGDRFQCLLRPGPAAAALRGGFGG
jgi:hypothetical protein